jgi:hypothetical protein
MRSIEFKVSFPNHQNQLIMEQELLDELEVRKLDKRPVFITVLCILTWVGSGILFFVHGFQYYMMKIVYDSISQINSISGTPDISDSIAWTLWGYLISCVCCLICAGAAIVMWKQRKWGFYLYAVAEITPLVISFYAISLSGGNHFSSIAYVAATSIIPIGFVILYAVNLKQMR